MGAIGGAAVGALVGLGVGLIVGLGDGVAVAKVVAEADALGDGEFNRMEIDGLGEG
jgi:hypothetical protein